MKSKIQFILGAFLLLFITSLAHAAGHWEGDVGGIYRRVKLTVDRDPQNYVISPTYSTASQTSDRFGTAGAQGNLSYLWDTSNPKFHWGLLGGLGWSPLDLTVKDNFGSPGSPVGPFSGKFEGNLFDFRGGLKLKWASRPVDKHWRWGVSADGGVLVSLLEGDAHVDDTFHLSINGPTYPAKPLDASGHDFDWGAYGRGVLFVGKGNWEFGLTGGYDFLAESRVGPVRAKTGLFAGGVITYVF